MNKEKQLKELLNISPVPIMQAMLDYGEYCKKQVLRFMELIEGVPDEQ